jgi:uncharacterized membrane protein YfcA
VKGFAIAAVINIVAAIAAYPAPTGAVDIRLVMLLGIGAVQALWIGPLYAVYRSKRETETAKGILLAAGITFLLNAGCWGYVVFPRG